MNEPLKNKSIVPVGTNFPCDSLPELFYFKDVRSAVKGLIEEIRTLDNETMHPSRKILACRIIREWFPDAIDNDTKERVE